MVKKISPLIFTLVVFNVAHAQLTSDAPTCHDYQTYETNMLGAYGGCPSGMLAYLADTSADETGQYAGYTILQLDESDFPPGSFSVSEFASNYYVGPDGVACNIDVYSLDYYIDLWNETYQLDGCSITNILPPKPKGEITVSKVHFEQVVQDPRLGPDVSTSTYEAVAGKSASFKIILTGNNLESATGSVVVLVKDSQGHPLSWSPSIEVITIANAISSTGSFKIAAKQMTSFFPTTSGPLTVDIIPSSGAKGFTTEPYTGASLNVHHVKPPKIAFIKIKGTGNCANQIDTGCIADPTDTDFQALFGTSQYVSRIYPVPDNSMLYSKLSSTITATPLQIPKLGIAIDLGKLLEKYFFTEEDRLVGVVSENYFQYHEGDENDVGITLHVNGTRVAIVSDYHGNLQVVPHELAHTYGVNWEDYIDDPGKPDDGDYNRTEVKGYDATMGRSFVYDPSELISDQIWSLMGPPRLESVLPGAPSDLDRYWIDKKTYVKLLHSLPKPASDPQVLMISGMLSESGEFTFGSSTNLSNGYLTPSANTGNLTISTLNSNNQTLSSVKLQSNFRAYVTYKADTPPGPPTIDLGYMPVVVALPQNSNVKWIQVEQNGVILKKTPLNAQLLQGILSSIPDNAFKRPDKKFDRSDRDRDDLNYIVNDRNLLNRIMLRAQNALSSLNTMRARGPLADLIEQIRHLTYNDYSVADASELTHDQVETKIEDIIRTLQPTHKDHSGSIRHRQGAREE